MPQLPLSSCQTVSPDWLPFIHKAVETMDKGYIQTLSSTDNWLPGTAHLFSAFSLPLAKTQFILLGESPYPRKASANGYAFWDAAVKDIWSLTGLSKTVNRATSLRNFIKMLLLTHDYLEANTLSQAAIADISKTRLIKTAQDLFENMQKKGILLLNASLVLSEQPIKYDAQHWFSFLLSLIRQLDQAGHPVHFILLGKIAEKILPFIPAHWPQPFIAAHPYNLSFIHDVAVQDFFKPFNLIYHSD